MEATIQHINIYNDDENPRASTLEEGIQKKKLVLNLYKKNPF